MATDRRHLRILSTDEGSTSTPPRVRFLPPVVEEAPVVSSPPPQDIDDATSPGLPLRFTPQVSMPPDMPMPPPSETVAVRAPGGEPDLGDGEINGTVLKRLRERRGLTINEMVEATKIRKSHLVAIEEQSLEDLPSRVYLRGYLTQIARVLRVDRHKLAEGYLAFVDRFTSRS